MANMGRQRFPAECLGQGRVGISGSFAPNGSSALAAASMYGTTGWTVAYTSTGLYTITLDDKWLYLLSAWHSLQLHTGSDKYLQWGDIDVASAKTLQLRCWDASDAAVADVAADSNNRIHFGLVLKRTTSGGKR